MDLFRVVNHGIPLEVLHDAQAQGLKFFDLPVEVKKKAGLSGTKNEGPRMDGGGLGTYVGDNTKQNVSSLYLAESLTFNFERREDIWPDGMTRFQHTDPFILTLLQDKVGGLQIKKDGEWAGVRPIEGALTINIGDSLHAWIHGIFKSVLHRVVVNEEAHRVSIGAFFNVDPHLTISAPENLVDDNHPRQYKPFTIMEYMGYTTRARDENKSTVRKGVAVLGDKFKFEE